MENAKEFNAQLIKLLDSDDIRKLIKEKVNAELQEILSNNDKLNEFVNKKVEKEIKIKFNEFFNTHQFIKKNELNIQIRNTEKTLNYLTQCIYSNIDAKINNLTQLIDYSLQTLDQKFHSSLIELNEKINKTCKVLENIVKNRYNCEQYTQFYDAQQNTGQFYGATGNSTYNYKNFILQQVMDQDRLRQNHSQTNVPNQAMGGNTIEPLPKTKIDDPLVKDLQSRDKQQMS